jgi:hypothetical protein
MRDWFGPAYESQLVNGAGCAPFTFLNPAYSNSRFQCLRVEVRVPQFWTTPNFGFRLSLQSSIFLAILFNLHASLSMASSDSCGTNTLVPGLEDIELCETAA